MPKTKTDKRSRLIQTAVKLAYRHGFRTTSLADIAEAAKVPVGNVYYYFKTKDEIGEAIVEQRLLELRTLQEQWDQRGSPKERLLACIENTFENRDLLARGGCPVGTTWDINPYWAATLFWTPKLTTRFAHITFGALEMPRQVIRAAKRST